MAVKVDPLKYEEFCRQACLCYGLSQKAAAATAHALTDADMRGVHTHGTLNLYPYLQKITAGGIDKDAVPEVVEDNGACAVVDGHNAMPPYVGVYGLDVAMRKAREHGMSYVCIRNSGHYGACSAYALMAAKQGFFAVALSNTMKNMGVPNGKGPVIGNSPICFASPAGKHRPVCMDIATSTVSGMKAHLTIAAGRECEPGWISDTDGHPITRPGPDGKFVLNPMGGHKGYGLSFFIEVLSSVLAGGAVFGVNDWRNMPLPASVSHAFLLIDVSRVASAEDFDAGMTHAISEMTETPAAEGTDGVRVPGEGGWVHYDDSLANGLELNDDIYGGICALAAKTGLNFDNCILG